MAETTVLRSKASPQNASPTATSAKPSAELSGALPVVHVNMNANGPQIRGGNQLKQGVQILPPKGAKRNFTTGGLANQPATQSVVILPPKPQQAAGAQPQLSADQLLLCRHALQIYIGTETVPENVSLAKEAVATIDMVMVAMTAAEAMVEEPIPEPVAPVPPLRPSSFVLNKPRTQQVNASVTPRRVPRSQTPIAPSVAPTEVDELGED